MPTRICLSVLAATLAACATGSTVTVTPNGALSQVSAPKSPDEIKVFRSAPADYRPVAVIEASQTPLLPDSADAVLGKMLARAGELGCDGLVLQVQDQAIGTAGPKVTSGWNGILANLPEDAEIAETWFGVTTNASPMGAPSYPDHFTLEGYRAECVVLR